MNGALALVRNRSLPRTSVEFFLDGEFVAGRWSSPDRLGSAIEGYVSSLQDLEKVRFSTSVVIGLTNAHRIAFNDVVEAADALCSLGWPVNWEQNVQAILEVSEIGLKNGELVDRYRELPDEVTLGDELALLGTVTFYRQHRSTDGRESRFKAAVLSSDNLHRYGAVILRHAISSTRFRRQSDWLLEPWGREFRIAI